MVRKFALMFVLSVLWQAASANVAQSESMQSCEDLVKEVQAKNKVQEFSCQKGVEKPAMYVVFLKGQDGNLVGMPKPADELLQIQCYKPYVKNLSKKFDLKFVYKDGDIVATENICAKQ